MVSRATRESYPVTIQVAGLPPVHTTTDKMELAGKILAHPEEARRALAVVKAKDGARVTTSVGEDRRLSAAMKAGAAAQERRVSPQRDVEDEDQAGPAEGNDVGGLAVDRLRSIIERVERLEEEKKALATDINDIFGEAKSAGFDVKVIKLLLRQRRQDAAEVEEQETLLDLYRRALGM